MKCIISPFHSCDQNIASERYFLDYVDEDIFYLYVNAPCIVIGRHQNAYAEINQAYVQAHGIDVVRRESGGGAVYHDQGNLNYGFIVQNQHKEIAEIFQAFTKPILSVLNRLGAEAYFSGRNDLLIEGKKFSGNAQYHTQNKVLLHGTLLFSSELEKLSAALNADPRKFQDKSVKSVNSRVTNILPYLSSPISMEEFSQAIIQEVLSLFPEASLYMLSEKEKTRIQQISDKKYSTWDWVYGKSPAFTYRHTLKYAFGLLETRILVEQGKLKNLAIYGDFFGRRELDELIVLLRDQPYERRALENILNTVPLEEYIMNLPVALFLDCLFDAQAEEK